MRRTFVQILSLLLIQGLSRDLVRMKTLSTSIIPAFVFTSKRFSVGLSGVRNSMGCSYHSLETSMGIIESLLKLRKFLLELGRIRVPTNFSFHEKSGMPLQLEEWKRLSRTAFAEIEEQTHRHDLVRRRSHPAGDACPKRRRITRVLRKNIILRRPVGRA